MSRSTLPVTEAELMAYVDGQLSPERRAAVEAAVADTPLLGAHAALWRQQNDAIATLYGPVANEPVPGRLVPHRMRRPAAPSWARLAAAALVLLALGGAFGWTGRDIVGEDEPAREVLIEAAVNAHRVYSAENRHAVEVAAAEQDHLVTWLSNRIARPIDAPDLTAFGLELVGGRLLPADVDLEAGPAAQLMYQTADGQRVTVYVTGSVPGEAGANETIMLGQDQAFYWANEAITCTVVGQLPPQTLEPVARAVFEQLTDGPYRGNQG